MSLYGRIVESEEIVEGLNAWEKRRQQLEGDRKFEALRQAAKAQLKTAVAAVVKMENYAASGEAGWVAAYDDGAHYTATNLKKAAELLIAHLKKPVKARKIGS